MASERVCLSATFADLAIFDLANVERKFNFNAVLGTLATKRKFNFQATFDGNLNTAQLSWVHLSSAQLKSRHVQEKEKERERERVTKREHHLMPPIRCGFLSDSLQHSMLQASCLMPHAPRLMLLLLSPQLSPRLWQRLLSASPIFKC